MTDAVFAALADPARREILTRLARKGPASTGALTEGMGMTRQGASRHLATLESCGLIRSRRHGRVIFRELNPEALRGTQAWIDELSRQWDRRLDRLRESYSEPEVNPE